jgi:protein-L-isoaspartate(D-aspartate) O-methyltransferase
MKNGSRSRCRTCRCSDDFSACTLNTISDIAAIRRAYARQMLAFSHGEDARLEAAFAAVPREDFLGSGTWTLIRPGGASFAVERNDPALIYQDVLVELDGARGVNNGSPSLHALMLSALGPREGERVLHIGAGAGYYSAIIAELVGPDGRVTAIEFDGSLADAATDNLRPWPQATVIRGDGAMYPTAEVDRIYVNFGVAHPADAWLDRLAGGGTLVFPLAVPRADASPRSSRGAVLRVARSGAGFGVDFVSPCGFVTADGGLAGTSEQREKMADALARPGIEFVRSLRRGQVSPERCWFWSPGWCLSYDLPE